MRPQKPDHGYHPAGPDAASARREIISSAKKHYPLHQPADVEARRDQDRVYGVALGGSEVDPILWTTDRG